MEFIYYARLECVSKLEANSWEVGQWGNSREQLSGDLLARQSLCNHGSIVGRVGGSRDIGESSTRLFFPRAIEAGSCCRWQHLVKGRDGGRRFFGDFETRRKKVKGRKKKWRGREEKDGDEVTGGCKRSTGHRRRTTIQPHHP